MILSDLIFGIYLFIFLFYLYLDLPPMYTYPPISMGYKGGPSLPEARLAEQATMEAGPAQPDAKVLPHPCCIQPLTVAEGRRGEKESGLEGEVVASQTGDAEDQGEETRLEAKGSSIFELESEVSGLSPCPSSASVPDPGCLVAATSQPQKVEFSPALLGQKSLEEPQQSKEQDSEKAKEVSKEDQPEKCGPEQPECTICVPVESAEKENHVEEGEGNEEENVEVVENEEKDEWSGMSPEERLMGLTCKPPAPSPSSDSPLASVPSTSAQLQGAYMWSLELLIAAALCATRDALYPPAPPTRAPSPKPHRGMEILGEVAELEIQQRSREKEGDGKLLLPFLWSRSKVKIYKCPCSQIDTHTRARPRTWMYPSGSGVLFC